jgi:hypothetical protein
MSALLGIMVVQPDLISTDASLFFSLGGRGDRLCLRDKIISSYGLDGVGFVAGGEAGEDC